MKIAVIPARGGSKRIPRKNIKHFCGKPMIAWSIEAALRSGCFDHVIVSTDDKEIAEISRQCGAEVPFLRPAHLSDDLTCTIAVISHAIEAVNAAGTKVTQVCCLYATAPFVRAQDLQQGQFLLDKTDCDYVFSVTSYAFPIQRALRLTQQQRLAMLSPQYLNTRSQDLEPAFHDAGQFYWGKSEAWCGGRAIFGAHSVPLVLPRYRVQDIDTPEDWERAQWMFKVLSQEQK